jgi:5-methylthioadenosine/S-adenosylhomocysteine deaminase
MRTLIQGGWVVGYEGAGHVLIPDGCVVFEGDAIVHVGKAFSGSVDRTIDARGKLVSPGLVNCHLHAAVNAGHTVFIEPSKTDYFGSNFLGYVTPRRGAKPPRTIANPDIGGRYGLWSALRCGATTILDVGTMPGGPDAGRDFAPRSTHSKAVASCGTGTRRRARRGSTARWTSYGSTTARTTAASAP